MYMSMNMYAHIYALVYVYKHVICTSINMYAPVQMPRIAASQHRACACACACACAYVRV